MCCFDGLAAKELMTCSTTWILSCPHQPSAIDNHDGKHDQLSLDLCLLRR